MFMIMYRYIYIFLIISETATMGMGVMTGSRRRLRERERAYFGRLKTVSPVFAIQLNSQRRSGEEKRNTGTQDTHTHNKINNNIIIIGIGILVGRYYNSTSFKHIIIYLYRYYCGIIKRIARIVITAARGSLYLPINKLQYTHNTCMLYIIII